MQGKNSKSRYVLNVEALLSLLHNHPIYYNQLKFLLKKPILHGYFNKENIFLSVGQGSGKLSLRASMEMQMVTFCSYIEYARPNI